MPTTAAATAKRQTIASNASAAKKTPAPAAQKATPTPKTAQAPAAATHKTTPASKAVPVPAPTTLPGPSNLKRKSRTVDDDDEEVKKRAKTSEDERVMVVGGANLTHLMGDEDAAAYSSLEWWRKVGRWRLFWEDEESIVDSGRYCARFRS